MMGALTLAALGLLLVTLLPSATHSTHLLDAVKEDFLEIYEGIARGNSCAPELLRDRYQEEDFLLVYVRNAQLASVPSLLATACTSTQLRSIWDNLAPNFTQEIGSLYFVEAGGNFFAGIHPQGEISEGFYQQQSQQQLDPRTLSAYTQAISSSKSVAIVNLDASDTQIDTLNAISIVLKETLNEDDYVALFSPGINTSDTEGSALNQATETKVARLCSQLAGASLSDNDTPDFQLLSSAINVLQENNASGISPCYQGLLIFLDSTTLETQELREMITSAFERNENLTIFLNVLDGLSAEEFANASRLFCNTKTVIQSISPADGYANRSVVNYVNYFFHGTQSQEAIVLQNNTSVFTNETVSTTCTPLIDYNTATVSASGVLLGVLCAESQNGDLEVPQTCPSEQLNLFEFSYLRHAYQLRGPDIPHYQYHCENIDLPNATLDDGRYLDLLEQFNTVASTIGRFSFEIVQSEFINATCPLVTGRVPTSCGENNLMTFTSDPNFLQSVSFSSSFLIWNPDLESILPITSADFNNLDSNQAIWQSVCASSYLEDPWRAVLTANPPSTFMYGDYSYGYTRVYPGYQSSAADCTQIDSEDARLQPWFVSAATGPKVVVILADVKFAFQDDIQEIKTALLAILNTLSQHDLFNVIITNSQEHRFDSLMPARLSNIAMARDYINQSDYSPESRDLNTAIRLAIQSLNNSLDSAQSNLALIVLTDNSFVNPSSFEFISMLHQYIPFFMQNKIRVYTFLFSPFQEGTLLKNISCTTGGLYDRLHDNPATEIALRVTAYYNFYAAAVQLNNQVWSEYFTDELTGLNSTRVCGPFYRAPQQDDTFLSLLGVSCIDVPTEDFTVVQHAALNSRIYNTSQLPVVQPSLTFEQENQLRGIHRCDVISATSAESFRFRVENVARLFRTTAENAFSDVSIPEIRSCPFGDRFFDSCDTTRRPLTTFSAQHDCNISANTTAVYSRGFLAGVIPVLNFSINAFGPGSETFERLCMSQALNDLWTDTSSSQLGEEGMLWHYYADAMAGFLRYHPYADCGLSDPEQCQTRAYDPRFRPWYVSSISASKAVYIIIHATRSDSFSTMQQGALDVLSTLTHRDFVQVYFAVSTNPQLFEGFFRSNSSVRNQLIDFIEAQQFTTGTADLVNVFTGAYQTFEAASTDVEINNCHQAIIFFTDSNLDQGLPTTVRNLQQGIDISVDIFMFTFGGLATDPTFAQQIACENGGEWFSVSDISGFEETIHSYYRFYSASVQNAGVVWSDFFTDVFTNRSIISACLPVYDPSTIEQAPLLLGVTCVDVDPRRFDDFLDGMEVLQSVIDAQATACPSRVITEAKREALRATKCLPPSLTTPQELATFYETAVQDAAQSHSQAYAEVIRSSSENATTCLFEFPLYESCAVNSNAANQFAPSDQFAANVSFDGLGLIFAPSLQELVNNGTLDLQMLSSDQPLFTSICPAIIEERTWQRSVSLNSNTSLQFFASEDGFLLTYPARQLSQELCQETYDPRVRPFYANTASGYKDVIVIVDLAVISGTLPLYLQAATENLLFTLSVLDYFTIIAGQTDFTPNLVRANTTTINDATVFISTIVYNTLEQYLMVRRAFEVLINSRSTDNSAMCQTAIIFITNRDITRDTVSEVTIQNEQFAQQYSRPVKIFVNTFGDPSYSGRELVLVCDNSGIWNVIPPDNFADMVLIREMVSSYYEVLAKAITLQDPLWSEVYEDAFGVGLVTTVCLPVYDTAINLGRLLGVSCIDVPVSVFQQFQNGIPFLNDLIESQQESQCSPLTLGVDEVDVLRPAGLRCLENATRPPTTPTTEPPSTTSTTTSGTTASGTTPPGVTETTRRIHSGAIVGIIFAAIGGTVILVIVVTACIAYWYKWKKKRGGAGFTHLVLEERLLDDSEDVDDKDS